MSFEMAVNIEDILEPCFELVVCIGNLAIILSHSFIFDEMTDLLHERELALGNEALILYEITDYCVRRLMVTSRSMTQP